MEDLPLPVEAQVVGEKVELLKVHYDGNERRGWRSRGHAPSSVHGVQLSQELLSWHGPQSVRNCPSSSYRV